MAVLVPGLASPCDYDGTLFIQLSGVGQANWGGTTKWLDRETNQARFSHYLDGYAKFMTDEERENALSRFKESPEASALLRRFLDVVFS